MCRTVEITCRVKDLKEILEKLQTTKKFQEEAAFTLSLDIEDTKENYQYLCVGGKVLDWRFMDQKLQQEKKEEKQTEGEKDVCNNSSQQCQGKCNGFPKVGGQGSRMIPMPIEEAVSLASEELEEKKILKTLENDTQVGVWSYDDYSNLIVSVWINLRVNPQYKFSNLFFKDICIPYILSRRNEKDNTIPTISLFIRSYYDGIKEIEKIEGEVNVLKDIVKKLKTGWEQLKEIEKFTDVIGFLFGPSAEVKSYLGLV